MAPKTSPGKFEHSSHQQAFDFPAIDIHVHPICPEVLAVSPPNFWPQHSCELNALTMQTLVEQMDVAGVTMAVLLALDVERTRGFSISNELVAHLIHQYQGRFLGFASVDPRKADAPLELKHAIATLKLSGLKLHPCLQEFYPNDKAAYPVYEEAQALGVPILFHTGQDLVGGRLKFGRPLYLDDVALDFPQLTIIAAHYGWPWVEEAISLALRHQNVYLDLSGWSPLHFPDSLLKLGSTRLDRKLLFGTDYPVIRPSNWRAAFQCLPLSTEAKENILRRNATQVLEHSHLQK